MNSYWCGWRAPDDIPETDLCAEWPACVQAWISGYGDDYTTWVAQVEADSACEAWAIILRCYGNSGGRLTLRWDPPEEMDAAAIEARKKSGRFS